jgi:hypothetical protein
MLRQSSVMAPSSQPGAHSSTSFCRHAIDAQHSLADRLPVRATLDRSNDQGERRPPEPADALG